MGGAVSLYPDRSRHLGRRKGSAFRQVRRVGQERKRAASPARIVGSRGELYSQTGDRYMVTDLLGQLVEARECGDGVKQTPGVDEWGRTRADRAAWQSFLRGFVLLLVLVSGRAGAQGVEVTAPGRPSVEPTMHLVEPTQDSVGNPLGTKRGGQDNSLVACWYAVGEASGWLKASTPAGGGRHPLAQHLPREITRYPVQVAVGCINATGPLGIGWSDPWAGRATVTVIRSGGD